MTVVASRTDTVRKGQTKVVEATEPIALPARERILLYGREGTGKTEGWLSIAELWSDVPFYVLDTDDAVQRMLETDHPDLKNVYPYVVQGWADLEKSIEDAIRRSIAYVSGLKPPYVKEQLPWIVVDFSDSTWDMVQNYYTEQVFNQGIDEFFLKARMGNRGPKLQPLEGWTDWQVINKLFQTLWNSLTKGGGPFHLYITARAVEPGGDLEAKSLYKDLKKMPGGEKRMGGRVHTVLMASVDKDGWYLSTAKDRGRPILQFHKSTNFAASYLVKVAGWRL